MTRMFPFITDTWNPLGGKCNHGCGFCWATRLAERYMHKKYTGEPRLITKEFNHRKWTDKDFIFVCDMCDLFGDWVPSWMIKRVIEFVEMYSPTQFLFLTKNPKRYAEFDFPSNCVIGATIETDLDRLALCNAPPRAERIDAMTKHKHRRKMVSVEPIMTFSPLFGKHLKAIKPEFVAVGYDNYNNNLNEPTLTETNVLIKDLEKAKIKVYQKTIREKVNCLP